MPDNNSDSVQPAADQLPAPNAATIMGAQAPAPNTSNLPVSTRQAPQPPIQVQNPDDAHTILGRGIRHIAHALEGKQVNYEPDGQGGVREVVAPRKPGGLFRDIVLGAIAGGAAASPQPGEAKGGSPAAGLFKGAMAGLNVTSGLQDQRKQAATEQSQRQSKMTQEDLAQAAIAQHTVSSVMNTGHHTGFHTEEEHDRLANATNIIKNTALKQGGVVAADVANNGEPGNGPALQAAYMKDNSLMQGPDGFHRIPFVEHPTDGLTYKNGEWLEQDGSPADWNKHSIVTLIDLPNSAWNKTVILSKRDANAAAGYEIAKGKPTDSVSTTYGSLFALGLKNRDQVNADRSERLRGPKDENEAKSWSAQFQAYKSRKSADQTSPDEDRLWTTRGPIVDAYDFKTAKGDNPFPMLKEGDVAGYTAAAQRVLSDPKSSPEQKQTAQQQVKYANDTQVTAQHNAAGLASARKTAEIRAEASQIDNTAVGGKGLPDSLQTRFQALPDTLKVQLTSVRTRDIASLFALADGDTSKTTFPARVYKGSNQISQADAVGLAKQLNPDWDEKTYAAKQRLVNNYTDSKKEGGQIEAFNNFLNHAGDAADVTANWRSSGSPWINTPLNTLRNKAIGDPRYSQFVAALAPVRKEYMSFLNANRAEHTEDLREMETILSNNSTPAQIEASLKQLTNTAVLRLDSLNENWRTVTGGNYPNLITPKAKQAAARLGYGDQVSQYGSGGVITAGSTRQTPPPTQAPPPQKGFTRIQASDGSLHDIPSGNLSAAKQIDPNLTVTVVGR